MRHENVWELYESGQLPTIVEAFDDVNSLEMIYTAMTENAVDFGVDPKRLERRMSDVNWELARKHRLEERIIADMHHRSLEQYDRIVALDVLRSQILAIVKSIDEFRATTGAA